MTKVAVVLSGCGYLDGAEIREAVLALLYLDQGDAEVSLFAPDIAQTDVVDHRTGEAMEESRNVLAESARIARGDIRPLSEADAAEFDALVLPGGYGVAKNLSDFAAQGAKATVQADMKRLIAAFMAQKKPIGAICISPAVLVAAVAKGKVTIGQDAGTAAAIEAMGGSHVVCDVDQIAYDDRLNIVSCPAYMVDARLSDVAGGIEKLVKQTLTVAAKRQNQAA